MEIIKGRGINCENEVYFDYVDGEIVMTMYKDMVGVRMDRRDPNVIKAFSIDQWEEINGYLRETLDDVEGVFDDRDDDGEDEEVVVTTPAAALPSVMPGRAIPLPNMTKDEIQERFDPITGTQNEEEDKEDGEENDEGNSKAETSS